MQKSSEEMNEDEIREKLSNLPSSLKEEFKKEFQEEKEKLEIELGKEYKNRIKSQIEKDLEEITAFNAIKSAFSDKDVYSFIRTEPLIYQKFTNFDMLIGSESKEIGILIEYERTLVSGLSRKLLEFFKERDLIKNNQPSNFDVDKYFQRLMGGTQIEYDYVISSIQLSDAELEEKAKKLEENFLAWDVGKSGNICRIHPVVLKKDLKEDFQGHTDPEVQSYLENEVSKGKKYQKEIAFTYSSSKYLKLKDMGIVLAKKFRGQDENFDFNDWKRLFRVELTNYSDEEKRILFKNFIDYGIKCEVIKIEEELGGTFSNKYRIKTRFTKDTRKLKTEVIEKMKNTEMKEELQKKITDMKEELVKETYLEYTTSGTTLDEFTD